LCQRAESMKICYVADGASIHTQRWVNFFARKGHKVHLIGWKVIAGYENNVQFHPLTRLVPEIWAVSQYFSFLLWILQVRLLIKRIKPDVIHGHFVVPYGFLATSASLCPSVVTAWGSDVLMGAKGWKGLLIKNSLKKADSVTCDAEHIMKVLKELGTNQEKISLIYFGTDTQKFSPGQRNEKLREQLGILNSPVVISLRSLTPLYDVESLVRAVPLVLKEVPEVKFVIAGDGEQRAYLNSLAGALKVSDRVRFVGQIVNTQLPEYLNLADVYVSTSLSDAGLSASTAEAMACGLPVITSDFGDNSKWVEDGINGFLIPLKNPEALAAKIIHLLLNSEDRTKFGHANRQVIETRNNYEKEMSKVEDIYHKLVDKQGQTGAKETVNAYE
jgi:glycosyltransferase involved in cell wall biosynthesis